MNRTFAAIKDEADKNEWPDVAEQAQASARSLSDLKTETADMIERARQKLNDPPVPRHVTEDETLSAMTAGYVRLTNPSYPIHLDSLEGAEFAQSIEEKLSHLPW
jgi:hypothetical protein